MKKISTLSVLLFLFGMFVKAQNHLETVLSSSPLVDIEQSIYNSPLSEDEFACNVLWKDIVYGGDPARNGNLLPYDFDHDGAMELIVFSIMQGISDAPNHVWYVLKYDSQYDVYNKIYISEPYNYTITKAVLADVDTDGNEELLIASNNDLFIFDFETLTTVHSLMDLPGIIGSFVNIQLEYLDFDHDGENEIIYSDGTKILLINTQTFEVEASYALASKDFAIGHVDDDDILELVLPNGSVYSINETGDLIEEFDFLPEEFDLLGEIKLTNCDEDPYMEAVIAEPSYEINVYDVDLQNLKYTIDANLDIGVIEVGDYNKDGVNEIFYGDAQWGHTYCHDATTGELLWTIDNPNDGCNVITLIDIVGDQTDEVVLISDYDLYIYNSLNAQPIWQMPEIIRNYVAVEIGDVDDDGHLEIVSLTEESDGGTAGGIITIYDALSKQIEYQSHQSLMSDVWSGTYNLEITDFRNDGDMDIVIAADVIRDATVWVIDGDQHNVEYQNEIEDTYSLSALARIDMNEDGVLEYVVATRNNVFVLDAINLNPLWQSNYLGVTDPDALETGDVDGDGIDEIIYCNYDIRIFGGSPYQEMHFLDGIYSTVALYDWDGENGKELIAGTRNGEIHVLNSALEIVASFSVSPDKINAIGFMDLNEDGQDEIIAASNHRLYFMTQEGSVGQSAFIASELGTHDAFKLNDYDADGQLNLMIGTSYGVLEIDPNCAHCIFFVPSVQGVDPICGQDNGQIILNSNDTTTVFSLQDEVLSSNIEGLAAGEYHLVASNANACSESFDLLLEQHSLEAALEQSPLSCGENDGMAILTISEGVSPYNILWSNGIEDIDTLTALSEGIYTVSLTDANDCLFVDSVYVEQRVLDATLEVTRHSCYGLASGRARVLIEDAVLPIDFYWDGEHSPYPYKNYLEPGTHYIRVTDGLNCEFVDSFFIDSVFLYTEVNMLRPSCPQQSNGAAQINVLEGQAPFVFQWNNWQTSDSILYILSAGSFSVSTFDANGCVHSQNLIIEGVEIETTMYATDTSCSDTEDGSAVVFTTGDNPPFSYVWSNGDTLSTANSLGVGTHTVEITDSLACTIQRTVDVVAPAALELNFNVVEDDLTTSDLEGSIHTIVGGGTPPYTFNWSTGDESANLTELGQGYYTLTVTDDNACLIDSTLALNLTAINELSSAGLALYPNPTADIITLKLDGETALSTLAIFNLQGKNVSNEIYVSQGGGTYRLDLSSLPAAVYILLVEIDGQHYRQLIERI